MFARIFLVLALVFGVSAAVSAQPGPPVDDVPGLTCMPYPGLGIVHLPDCPPAPQPSCPTYDALCLYFPIGTTAAQIRSYDFANAFLGVAGLEWTFVSLKNKTDVASKVVVEVTVTGRPPIRKDYDLGPQERPEPVNLGDTSKWPELADVHGGISVIVYANQDTAASVTMHPRITNPADAAQVTAFWRESKTLEGR